MDCQCKNGGPDGDAHGEQMQAMTSHKPLAYAALLAAAAVVAVAAILGVVIASGGESAGPENGVTLSDVLSEPTRFDGDTVTVSGEWAENRYFDPEDASLAIVIGDDSGQRLLVVPSLGTDLPRLDEDSVVHVRGTVHALTENDTTGGYVEPGGILASPGVNALLVADRVEITPPPRITSGPDTTGATLAAIAGDPAAYDGSLVNVGGTAHKTKRGFVLTADGHDLFVSAPASELDAVGDGERVRVQAKVQRLSGLAAQELEHAVQTDPPGPQPGEPASLQRLPVDPGEPYLLLRSLA
jgi:hypothetical protein